ncbi:sensor histidine kinase [Paenibacillus thermotolerans]|uniref:sensor histidine kinase n=1 Tax=Paenibacillus thermotolerans TaxID=3027807 RepID=UPI002367FC58|nr:MULTISPECIES: sensor histidine kinase [unclassified Paenibacillus]
MLAFRVTLFSKIITFLVVLFIFIIAFYFVSYRVSVDTLKKQAEELKLQHLRSFLGQIDNQAELLASSTFTLSRDESVRIMALTDPGNYYDSLAQKQLVAAKLNMYVVTSSWSAGANWQTDFAVYAPKKHEIVSTDSTDVFLPFTMPNIQKRGWQLQKEGESYTFSWNTVEPYSAVTADHARLIVQVHFPEANLSNMLDKYKQDGSGDPFLFHPEHRPITNHSAKEELIGMLVDKLAAEKPQQETEASIVSLNGRNYQVYRLSSSTLGWELIDYMSLEDALAPIKKSRNLFYASILCLLGLSVAGAMLFYKQVQVPIRELVRNVGMVTLGNYSARIKPIRNDEFQYLFDRFNKMAEEIQRLIQNVYTEQLRSREATLKQLQSQINPHFLYNCLFFIKNAAKLNDEEAVEKMAVSLGEYFRYATRLEKATATIAEESGLIHHYLTIQKLRMRRLQFEISIPERMNMLEVPRLILQPIVENAVKYGVEQVSGAGIVRITGVWSDGECGIVVEDNGKGLSESEQRSLESRLDLPLDSDMGYGVWNVHQRLKILFGERAGLRIEQSELGGLKVSLHWPEPEKK